jgi:hypothetical protein
MFRPSLVHQQGVYSSVKQWLDLIMCFGAVEMMMRSNFFVYSCTLPDDGPVRAETCSSLCTLKYYCNYNEVCVFVGVHCNNFMVV